MKKIFELSTKVFFLKTIFRLLLLFFLPLVLASCGDKKESAQSCSIQLDEQKYSTVSENKNCSNYERGSAYLGRAGMSFANFLKTGATDNLTKTLGISKLSSPTDYTTGNRGFVTKALCLVGANTFVTSSRCNGSSRTRSTDELEISMFANIADFIYLNYGVLDNDSNGTLSDTEVEGFTKLQTGGISVDGLGTGLTAYNRFEVVAGSSTYIAKSDLTKCVSYNGDYTVDPSTGDGTCAALQLAGSVTELRPIFKLDNMTDITAGGTLNTLVSMVSELSMISSALSSDFDSVGISSENSVRKQLTLGLGKLDNGAKDNNPTANGACTAVTLFDVMFLLVKNSADNSTTVSELKSANLISTADLINAVDGSLSLLPAGASAAFRALPMKSARIVYASSSGYTDSYEKAESSLYQAMKNTRSLGIDDSIKGDGKVTFRELICVAEN
jgi:hypothetical protein